MPCSTWCPECFTHRFSVEEEESIHFQSHCLYVMQLAWEGPLLLVVIMLEVRDSAVTSDPERLISLQYLTGYPP